MAKVEVPSSKIICRQCDFVYCFSKDFMSETSYAIHFSHLFFFIKQTVSIIFVSYLLFYNIFSFPCISLFPFFHFTWIKLWSYSNKFFDDFSTCFIFHQSNDFFVFFQLECKMGDLLESWMYQTLSQHHLRCQQRNLLFQLHKPKNQCLCITLLDFSISSLHNY